MDEYVDMFVRPLKMLQKQIIEEGQEDKKVLQSLKTSSILSVELGDFVDLMEKNSRYVKIMLLRDIALSLKKIEEEGIHVYTTEQNL